MLRLLDAFVVKTLCKDLYFNYVKRRSVLFLFRGQERAAAELK
ncbi:hypothetical protein [Niabella soli]|nr:hypothetical protein [Niabella soli]